MAKKFYKSKTLWINALLVIAGIATAIAGNLETGAGLSVIGIGEMILRVLTKEKVK